MIANKITEDARKNQLTVYLPDTRGVTVSRFGRGNLKIGAGVYTYSRLPGKYAGTCPGSSSMCEEICYAKRVVLEGGVVADMWAENGFGYRAVALPDALPPDCRLLRLHISGDFDTVEYVEGWTSLIRANPGVRVWAYTRSWRVPELLPSLERLRALPNVQLFASMDASIAELPPTGWRVAWIDGDERCSRSLTDPFHQAAPYDARAAVQGRVGYVCPEETGRKRDCEACGYCFDGRLNDVVFLRH